MIFFLCVCSVLADDFAFGRSLVFIVIIMALMITLAVSDDGGLF